MLKSKHIFTQSSHLRILNQFQRLSQQNTKDIRQMSDRNINPHPKTYSHFPDENHPPRSRRSSQDLRLKDHRTETSPTSQHTFADYFKQPSSHTSKVSTRTSPSQNSYPSSRRSTLSDARSLEKISEKVSVKVQNGGQEEKTQTSIFAELSNLMRSEEVIMGQYKKKMEGERNKVATVFQHLKDDLKLILQRQESIIYEELNVSYKGFISLFENTKREIHRLYEEKMRFFSVHEDYMNVVKAQQKDILKSNSNPAILTAIKTQNSQAMFARKYEAFFQNKKFEFEQLAKMKRQIDESLERNIFDYNGNINKINRIKHDFRLSVESHYANSLIKQSYGM